MNEINIKMNKLIELTKQFQKMKVELEFLREQVLDEMEDGAIDKYTCDNGQINLRERKKYNWNLTSLKTFLGEEAYNNVTTIKVDGKLVFPALKAKASDEDKYENVINEIGNPESSKFIMVKINKS